MELNKIHHIAIINSDLNKSKHFYIDILGLELIREVYRKERDDYKLDLKIGDSEIELFIIKDRPARPSYPESYGLRHLAFKVDDIEVAVKELEAKGVKCEAIRLDEITNKRMTFFFDPDNQPLELHE